MHELGVLCHAIKSVEQILEKSGIEKVKYITLEVGKKSGYLPVFFEKLFPIAIENYAKMKGAVLRIVETDGEKLLIRDIGY